MKYTGYDFCGWATRNDIHCTDGRTIRENAFKDDDGKKVPIVWGHQHDAPDAVLGHGYLENRPEGVRVYGYLNDTPGGQYAKELVKHGDITSLSIWANQLKEKAGNVMHGSIKEVSLVLAGANRGAYIDYPVVAHSEDEDTEAYIYVGEDYDFLCHEDAGEDKDDDKEEPKVADGGKSERTIQDVIDSMTEEQKNVMYYLVGKAIKDNDGEAEHSDNMEDDSMHYNVFEQGETGRTVLSHDDFKQILSDAKANGGSLKSAVEYNMEEGGVLAHADYDPALTITNSEDKQAYFVNDPDFLFPDARALNNIPQWIKRDDSWVAKVLNGAKHTPFSRIKSTYANLTEDEARAKGYIKGKVKKEQVFSLLKRTTSPQTIYKKQKMDRDDVIDITDFDVVSWIKGEMRGQLNEEIARAALIGDGRLASDDDKISPEHIRPIYNDADLFTIKVGLNLTAGASENDVAKAFIRNVIKARKNYRGSGNPDLFTTEDMLTMMLLLEDDIGRPLYADAAALARKMRVSSIITVPVMEDFMVSEGNPLYGIVVNMNDYTFGADKGGAVSMFDDFDIDVNQQKYLIETRCSGSLTVPYSAIAVMGTYNSEGDGTDVFHPVKKTTA